MHHSAKHLQRFFYKTACALSFILFAGIWISSLFITAFLCKQSWSHEAIVFVHERLLANLFLTLFALFAVLLLKHIFELFSGVRFGAIILGAWCLGTLTLVWGANIVQMYDFAYVLEGAQLFARGNYKPMTIDYFNVCSYQLGICLPMEFLQRIFPRLNLSLFMQCINVFLSAGIIGILATLCRILFSEHEAKATLILSMLFLPLSLQCIFVYSTLPMLFLVSLAVLCLALYLRGRKLRHGVIYVICIACAYMIKPNAAIPLLAMSICALLDVMTSRDIRLLFIIILSTVCSIAFKNLLILQYELRAGVTLTDDVSMLARLVMGLQSGGAAAGWYTRYIEQFFPFDVTSAQEYAIASADLSARLAEMKADPLMTLSFFKDKLLSQWLEPSYGAMWYGDLCEHAGSLSSATRQFFQDGGPVRTALERFMGIYQKLLYLLTAIGLFSLIREKKINISALILPVCALGGSLYHMIFEAKAQYMYPYIVLMIPIAAHGLCILQQSIIHSKPLRTRLSNHRVLSVKQVDTK